MTYKNKSLMTKKRAFTLIELLIVIAIIGILFVVLVSKVDFATDKAKATGVQTDFRSFQMAFEQVARENAGFAMFGWDTGDIKRSDFNTALAGYTYENEDKDKGDRVRNSYDEGDMNLDGVVDAGEVWTGRKVYTENWTGVYTLMRPGNIGDMSAVYALESAINKNLDPKLHITINEDYTITMANQARDPWGNEYHGYYLSNASVDGKDRGAIVMYSNGANGEFGLMQAISNGVVSITIPGNNIQGQDDMSLVSCYSYANGYGETKTTTTGFSNNQKFLSGNGTATPSTDLFALNGTKWTFKNELAYDESLFGVFDWDEQTGWDEFSADSYITNGSITFNCYGFTIGEYFGVYCFGPVHSTAVDYTFIFIPENELGFPSGWWVADEDFVIDFLEGNVTDPQEAWEHCYQTIAPTIVFSNETSEILEDTDFINWLQTYATRK